MMNIFARRWFWMLIILLIYMFMREVAEELNVWRNVK